MVTGDQILRQLAKLLYMPTWPELRKLFLDREQPRGDWQLAVMACRAVGGREEDALPAVAAIACIKASFILVDGILDEDPVGLHNDMGWGRAANLGLGLLAAGNALIEAAPWPTEQKLAVIASLSRMALTGAAGQELDAQNRASEDAYWEVVRAKGSPFYASSLEIGALVGGASAELARQMWEFGALFGEIVQIYDDLEDAFKVPAAPDWQRGYNNLAILFGLLADHPDKERLIELRAHITQEAGALREAQEILVRCGAVAYCLYHLTQRVQKAREMIEQMVLSDARLMWELLDTQVAPLRDWLHTIGSQVPSELDGGIDANY
ncbi:MAG: hypothetical protein Kow0047_13440 [Anaerolineae bacterium]